MKITKRRAVNASAERAAVDQLATLGTLSDCLFASLSPDSIDGACLIRAVTHYDYDVQDLAAHLARLVPIAQATGANFAAQRTDSGWTVKIALDLVLEHNAETHARLRGAECWKDLPLVGEQDGLELRNCTCGTTLAKEIAQSGAIYMKEGKLTLRLGDREF